VDSHAAYCEDRETKDAPINLPELPLALTHLSVVKKRWCREWANAAVLADRAGREEPMTMECTKKEAHEFIEELSLSDCPCFGKEFNGDWYAISFDSIVSLIGMARRPKNWVAAPSPAEPLLPRECRHCFVRCADCPEPAEPPAAPVHQEPVARRWMESDDEQTWWCYAEANEQLAIPLSDTQPLYTHPSADLRAELAEAQEDLRHEVAFRHEQEAKWGKVIDDALAVANRAEAEREILRALLQGILDNHGHVFEHQIAEIRAALSKSK